MDDIDFQPVDDGIDFHPVPKADGIDFQPVSDGIDFEPAPLESSQLGPLLRQDLPPAPVSTLTQPYLYVPKNVGTGPITTGTAPQPADLSGIDEKFSALKALAADDPQQYKEVEAARQQALRDAGVGVLNLDKKGLPRLPQAKSTVGKVASGLFNAGSSLVEGAIEPENVAMMAALPARLVSAVFALKMAADAPEAVKATYKAVQDGDWQKASELGASDVVGAWLVKKLGTHALHGSKPPNPLDSVAKDFASEVQTAKVEPGSVDVAAIDALQPKPDADISIPRRGLRVDEESRPIQQPAQDETHIPRENIRAALMPSERAVIDQSLSALQDHELDHEYNAAVKKVDTLEGGLDNGSIVSGDPSLISAQDKLTSIELEKYRRGRSQIHTGDLFYELSKIAEKGSVRGDLESVRSNEDFQRAKILYDIIKSRQVNKAELSDVYDNLSKDLTSNTDYREVVAGRMGDVKRLLSLIEQEAHQSTNPEQISSNPAEPRGRPAEAHTAVEPSPPESRLGIAPPGTSAFHSFLRAVSPESLEGTAKGLAGHSLPRITTADPEVGEAGVRYASSKIAAKPLAIMFADRVVGDGKVDPVKLGAALTEDNLRSVKAESEDPSQVATIIGVRGSPFRTEAEYQSFLQQPATQQAIARHIEAWKEIIEPQYKAAQAIDPSIQLPSRGEQTGARINLFVPQAGDVAFKGVQAGLSRGNLTASFKRKSPFARQAKGTGERYEISYPDIIANTFNRQLEIANQNKFNRMLVEKKLAVIGPPGRQVIISGQPAVAFPLSRRMILSDGKAIPAGQNLYIRGDLAREYRAALDTDAATKFPGLSHFNNLANRAALAGLTDASVHIGNLMTVLATRPGGHLVLDSLAKATGRVDMPVVLYKLVRKALTDNKAQIAHLAEIGALREAHPPGSLLNPMNLLGRVINSADRATRLVMDDVFTKLSQQGIAERSETNRREFINQVGQYNKRLQGPLIRFARDSGFGPFATAGKTFNTLGLRNITMSPGMKATSPLAALALRANVFAGWFGAATLMMAANYLLTRDKGGGVMGRPGTPIGRIDTGKNNKEGRPLTFPFFDNLSYGRALRVTGVSGYANMRRGGASSTVAGEKAMTDVANAWTSPFFGPAVQAAAVTGAGHHAALGVPPVAPTAAPGQNQYALNAKTAAREANPIIASYLDRKEGKTVGEALSRQLPRLTLKAGMDEQKAGKLGEVMDAVKAKAYIDSLIRESKRLPVGERWAYIQKRYKEDGLPNQYLPRLVNEFTRHGRY